MTRLLTLLAAGLLALPAMAAQAQEPSPQEPDGYRNDDYRSPTPATLRGARTIATAEAEALWRAGEAVFIDVMPHVPRPANLPAGTIWRDKPRMNIPGSIWLPDTGYGALAAITEDYLRVGIERATGGDPKKTVVIYCLRDCWMSWNAAKRLVSWGYTNVVWYPDGVDGWQFAGLPVTEAKPAVRPRE
jgi:PQQ-dependent catabolism-associated CXXCW motif protein